MSATLTHIYRHPIKSHGREALAQVALEPGKTLPWDRHWAVAHEAATFSDASPEWVPCVNFSRGAKAPDLMAINAALNEAVGEITLSHPNRPTLRFAPDDPLQGQGFIDWVRPISPPDRALPTRIVRVPGRGMTDTDFPSLSVLNMATNRALSAAMGIDLSALRWRGNLWIDGFAPWSEFDWIGRDLRVGDVVLEVRERITRCMATTVNPATGISDADTLAALNNGFGHQDFGVYTVVKQGGTIRPGDAVEVL